MMDLAQPIASTAPTYPVLPAPQTDSRLPLSGAGPFTVDVKIASDHLEFSQNGGPSYTDGIDWSSPKGTTQTNITFDFRSATITDLTSSSAGLTFAAASGGKQVGTVQAPSSGTATYNFTVIATGGNHDAKIVVTPIGGTGDDI